MVFPEHAADTQDHNAKSPDANRLGELQVDDFEDPDTVPPPLAYDLSDITRHGGLIVGLEEIDQRGEVALHPIIASEFHIGRLESCNLVLWGDNKASRRHARIYREGEDFMLEDNASANGTLLNGEKLQLPCALQNGDRIVIGSHEFTFVRRINTR